MKTVASQSTAPKCSSHRLPRGSGAGGRRNVRRYQSRCWSGTARRTPESCDSIGNGTRIVPSKRRGRGAALSSTAYSQRPFRLTQSGRTICGRGYSGRGRVVSTAAAQRVRKCGEAAGTTGCWSTSRNGTSRACMVAPGSGVQVVGVGGGQLDQKVRDLLRHRLHGARTLLRGRGRGIPNAGVVGHLRPLAGGPGPALSPPGGRGAAGGGPPPPRR